MVSVNDATMCTTEHNIEWKDISCYKNLGKISVVQTV